MNLLLFTLIIILVIIILYMIASFLEYVKRINKYSLMKNIYYTYNLVYD